MVLLLEDRNAVHCWARQFGREINDVFGSSHQRELRPRLNTGYGLVVLQSLDLFAKWQQRVRIHSNVH